MFLNQIVLFDDLEEIYVLVRNTLSGIEEIVQAGKMPRKSKIAS